MHRFGVICVLTHPNKMIEVETQIITSQGKQNATNDDQ